MIERQEYRRLSCSECGVVYFFPEDWCGCAEKIKRSWHCPNGHGQWFHGESFEDLRRSRERLKQENARLEEETAIARRRADKAEHETKRIKKRAAAGTCPCCQRSFSNMAEHMKKEHPAFIEETGAKVIQLKSKEAVS